MSRARLIEGIFIGLIFVIVLGANLYLHLNTPFWSDNSRDANIITQIAQSGEISSTLPYQLATPDSSFPILYPQLYFVLVATVHQFIGPFSLNLVPSIAVAFLIVAIYILGKHLCGRRVGLIASLVAVPAIIGNKGIEAEMSLLLLVVLSLFAFHQALQTGRRRWLLVTGIFAAGAVGMKQAGWFAIVFIVLAAIIYAASQRNLWRKYLRDGLITIVLAAVLFFPVLSYQFSTTGHIFFVRPLPGPMAQVEEGVVSWLGIEGYESNLAFRQYHSSSGLVSSRIAGASPGGTIRFLNGFSNKSVGKDFLGGFFILFLSFGAVFIFRDRNRSVMALALSLALVATAYMSFIQLPSYFTVLPLLAGVIFSYGLVRVGEGSFLTRSRLRMAIQAVLVIIIISGVLIASVLTYADSLHSSVRSMPKQTEYQEMGEWIDEELPEDAIILGHRQHELAQYAHRKIIWLNPVGGTELYEALRFGTDSQLADIMDREGVSYIFIDKTWVGNPNKWIAYVSPKAVERLERSHHFEQIFGTKRTKVYQLVRPGEQTEEEGT